MFGFFKNKNKDKTVNIRDKKKDRANKDDKEDKETLKVTARKNKEDKISKSLFRKSKSIERTKEENEDARKSQNLDLQVSGDWGDYEQFSPQDSCTIQSEEAASPPSLANNSSSCEDAACSTSPCRLEVVNTRLTSNTEFSSSTKSSSFGDPVTSGEAELQTSSGASKEQKNEKKYLPEVLPSTSITPAFSKDSGYPHQSRNCQDSLSIKDTKKNATKNKYCGADNTATLIMKPPLNPRVVTPRGPLASTTNVTLIQASSKEPCRDKDENRLTPSPGMITPPSSPGLCSSFATTHHPYSRPTSPDGRASMLSTPSSSTSSLSSITPRPISPSGRRTPPGPRMGTGGRLTSSPTAGRKAIRTNIKTNPSVASRRAGSNSPVNFSSCLGSPVSFVEPDSFKTPPSSPVASKHVFPGQATSEISSETNVWALPPTDITSKLALSPLNTVKGIDPPISSCFGRPSLSSTGKIGMGCSSPPPPRFTSLTELKNEGGGSPGSQRSVSPTIGKARHSISSMHSLESIPENDSDGQPSVGSEKTLDGNKLSCTLPSNKITSPKEQQQIRGTSLQLTRHSAPETISVRQHSQSVTHKRSSSLTPVNEERKINFSVSISEMKAVSGEEMQGFSGSTIEDGKVFVENAAVKQCKPEHPLEICSTNDIDSQKELKDVEPKNVIGRDKAALASSREGYIKLPGVMTTSQQSDSRSLANAVSHISQENDKNVLTEKGCFKPSKKNNSSAAIDQGKETEEATHIVLRIPLRSNDMANREDAEKRASVEILSHETRRPKQQEREHCKARPRSVSTSRELRRESTSERHSRSRFSSEGNGSRNEVSTSHDCEGKKERSKEKTRCRSSSSGHNKSLLRDQSNVEAIFVAKGNENYDGGDEIFIPRREIRKNRSGISKAYGSHEVGRARSEDPPSNIQDEGRREKSVKGATNESEVCEEKISLLSAAPSRHRSMSRGMERRITRSVTLSEIKRIGADTSASWEQRPQRRAKSSSRAQEGLRFHSHMPETGRPKQEGKEGKTHAPPRRKHSIKMREAQTQKESEEDVKQLTRDSSNPVMGNDYRSKKINVKDSQVSRNSLNECNKTASEDHTSVNIKDTKSCIKKNVHSRELILEMSNVETQTTMVESSHVALQTVIATETKSKLSQTEEDLQPEISRRELEDHTR